MINYLEKYLKYKQKYINLKKIQKGGVECTRERVFKNFLGTCWAVIVQMMITLGDVTGDNLQKIMMSFKVDDDYRHNIKSIKCFIKRQIERVQNDFELKQAFPTYIFDDGKISNLQNILVSFIDRYYSKVFNIKNESRLYSKSGEDNPKRCELVIAKNFKELFNLHSDSYGASIVEEYLFANLLSTFFLGYKVSFTNYYENDFCKINYNDTTDIGIIITIEGHACCFFTCNGTEKYYNNLDNIIYDCHWKEQLKKSNDYSLYVKNKSCLILLNKKLYKSYKYKNNISKVYSLTVVSKYNSSNSNTLDIEIQNIFNKTNLDKIKDRQLQCYLGILYYEGVNKINKDYTQDYTKYREYCELAAFQNYSIAQNNLGYIYEKGIGVTKNYIKAKEYYELAVDQDNPYALNNLGELYENGHIGIDLKKAKEYYERAADQNHNTAQYNLGRMYENGIGIATDFINAKKYYELAASQYNIKALIQLGQMFELGNPKVPINLFNAKHYYKIAADKGDIIARNHLKRLSP